MANLEQIIPVLTYQDIAAAHDFLVVAFGFSGGGVHRNAEGQAVHGEVRAGKATIWLQRDEQARTAGARINSQPVDQPYGQREYGTRDLEGHRWWFATPTAPQRQE